MNSLPWRKWQTLREKNTWREEESVFCLFTVVFLLGPLRFPTCIQISIVIPVASLQRYGPLWKWGAMRKFLGSLVETMVINTLEKLCSIRNTLSTRVQTLDRCCANVWQKCGLSLLLGVSVAFWYCKQLTQPRRSSVSEIVYTKEFHLSVCLQFTCEWAKPS